MSRPGYVYLIKRETEHGDWVKVGVAARIGRVKDHREWVQLIRTFESDCVLADAYALEQVILKQFPASNAPNNVCSVCGAPKPTVGRNGCDGLTEVRHLECYPGIPSFFEEKWKQAPRLPRDSAWRVNFDPQSLRPGGFQLIGDPWRQPPEMDPSEYQNNTCNVFCIRGISASVVVTFLDSEWEKGTVDLRKAMWNRYGEHCCKMDGTPTPKAKGSGAQGLRSDVENKLLMMTKFDDVEIVMVSVRKPGMLYAYRRPEAYQ